MSSAWLPYLPEHLARAIVARPAAADTGRARRMAVVALFADISGFTPMSEALARSGRRGAEDMTLILNRYFTRMIALLHDYGGIVCKFGGDALTVIFPYQARARRSTTRRAVACAHAMQAAMSEYTNIPTSAGSFGLGMKIGIARGTVLSMSAGDHEQLEYILAGSPLDRCAEAEHHAEKGQVLVENSLLDDLGALESITPRGDFSWIGPLLQPARPQPLAAMPDISPAAAAVFARFLHPTLAQRIAADQTSFINEHRQVNVLFVNFADFDYDNDPAVASSIQAYFRDVFAIIRRYDGFLNWIDTGDKGSKYIVLFGAPVAREDDPARAVGCALELLALPVRASIGLTTGFVYCGLVGAPDRRAYTVMGDQVNLAARLMQNAQPGQLLAADATMHATAQLFDWVALDPIQIKGKRDPVAAYTAQHPATSPGNATATPAHTLVGRASELGQVQAAIARAADGHGQIIALRGETGIGKSRLLAEITRSTPAGYRIYTGTCQSYGGSYQGWRTIWRAFFAIDQGDQALPAQSRLEHRLAELAPHLALRTPLLALPLQLPIPDNDLTRTLDPQLRDRLLKSLLVACIQAEAARGPLLLVIDDCHWIDQLSQELLELIGRSIAELPVVLLLAARTPTDNTDPLGWLAPLAHAQLIPLNELDHHEATALVRSTWQERGGAHEPPPEVIAQLLARAQGNPLYLEELSTYVYTQPDTLVSDLPDTLQQLILSRIDRLDTMMQATIKTASVIGAQVPASWLIEGYPQLGGPAVVAQQIDTLQQLELFAPEPAAAATTYRFHHTLLRDTAYASLAFSTRAMLHEQLGSYIEQRYAEGLDQQLDALAYHYGRTENTPKQRVYFRRAGDAARATYANAAAIDYYQQLMPLLEPAEQGPVLHALGEVWRFTGEWQRAEDAIRRALALAEAADDRRAMADCARTLGALVARTQSYDLALPWLNQACSLFEQLHDQPGLSRALEQLSFAHYQLGATGQALIDAERQLAVATAISDQIGRSDALAQIGLVAARMGQFERALDMFRQSRVNAEAAGYRRRTVLAANDIAGIHWQLGDLAQALEWLLRGIADADEIGYVWVLGLMIGNAGLIYSRQGEDEQARACSTRALQIALDLGDLPGIVPSLGQLAALFTARDNDQHAIPICERAIALAHELNLRFELCEQLELRAELLLRQHQYADALTTCVEARELAEQIEEGDVAARTRVLELRLRVAAGDLTAAAAGAALDTLLAAAPDDTARALIFMVIWQIDPQRNDARAAAAESYRQRYAAAPSAELRRHYHTLTGMELPPPPPLPALPAALMGTPAPLDALLARAGVPLPAHS